MIKGVGGGSSFVTNDIGFIWHGLFIDFYWKTGYALKMDGNYKRTMDYVKMPHGEKGHDWWHIYRVLQNAHHQST